MVTLVRRFAFAALAIALAGAARAQSSAMINNQGGMMGTAPAYQTDPNSFINQPPPGGPPGAGGCREAKPLAGVPKVARIMPAPGSTVRPGAMVLSVTFDRPMACANLESSRFPLPCPDGQGAVIISTDRRTLTTVCVVEAGASYSMPIVDFVADGGARSERYDLTFTTSTEAPLTDPRRAMALEKAGPAR